MSKRAHVQTQQAPGSVERALRTPGHELGSSTRALFERRYGSDLGAVRVREDRESTHAIGASAYTVGDDLVFAPGRYAPQTREGAALLGHELAHVVQQRSAAAIRPLEVVRDDDETEIDARRDRPRTRLERLAVQRAPADVPPNLEAVAADLGDKHAVLKRLPISANALGRILAKTDPGQRKGQLFEELTETSIRARLGTESGRASLGLPQDARDLEFIPGHLIKDASGKLLTDGVIGIRSGRVFVILVVFEAKAGSAAAQELRTASRSASDLSEQDYQERLHEAVEGLRLARPELASKSRAWILENHRQEVETEAKKLKESERGGQTRLDIERLGPDVESGEGLRSIPRTLVVDGVETEVWATPKTTTIVGVIPSDLSRGRMEKDLAKLGLTFRILQPDVTEVELQRVMDDLAALRPVKQKQAPAKAVEPVEPPAAAKQAAGAKAGAAAEERPPQEAKEPAVEAKKPSGPAGGTQLRVYTKQQQKAIETFAAEYAPEIAPDVQRAVERLEITETLERVARSASPAARARLATQPKSVEEARELVALTLQEERMPTEGSAEMGAAVGVVGGILEILRIGGELAVQVKEHTDALREQSFSDWTWWMNKGIALPFTGVIDEWGLHDTYIRVVDEKGDVHSDQLDELQRRWTDVKAFTVGKVPNAAVWRRLEAWLQTNVLGFDDFYTYFIAGNPPVRWTGNVDSGTWSYRIATWGAWTGASSDVVDDPELTRIMNATAARMIRGTQAAVGRAWEQRHAPRVERPATIESREHAPRRQPGVSPLEALRPTREARFAPRADRTLYSVFATREIVEDYEWHGVEPRFLVFDDDFTSPEYVLVGGADYNTYAVIRRAAVPVPTDRVYIPKRRGFFSDLDERESRAINDSVQAPGRAQWVKLVDDAAYSGYVEYLAWRPNAAAVLLARKADLADDAGAR